METESVTIELTKIRDDIVLLTFNTKEDLASTFLRFQEHYESPEFQGKIFSLDEFKEWYSQGKSSFSYYTDWSGFNIPSRILDPFLEGKFHPLTVREEQFLDLFKGYDSPFYIIGLSKETSEVDFRDILKHETAHALFTLVPQYRESVLFEIRKYDTSKIKEKIKALGYAETVLEDETHAYALSGSRQIPMSDFPAALVVSLDALFFQYS